MIRKTKLISSIKQLVKEKRVEGIYDLRDESDRQGMRIVIELKREANPQLILNKLLTYTKLQDTIGVIMLALVDGEPKVLTLKSMLEKYLEFQVDVIRRRTRFELKKALERSHILQGFVLATDYIDEVMNILRTSRNVAEAKSRMIERFKDIDMSALLDRSEYDMTGLRLEAKTGLSSEQADAIVQMRLGQLTGLERQKITDELYSLIQKISELEEILEDIGKVYDIILADLNEIRRKFTDERRTEIQAVSGEVDVEDLIPVEESVVTLTSNGYIKRMPVDEYKTQRRGGRGVTGMKQRDEDYVEEMFVCSSHDNILFISNKGIMYKLKCYEIPDGSKASRGFNLINLLPLSENEKISSMIKTENFDKGKYIVFVTKNAKIKRTELSAFKNVRKSGLVATKLDEGDEIAGVRMTCGESQLFIATHNGMVIRINENEIRSMSRVAHGVRAIKLREGDYVVSMARMREGASLLTITEKGYGKRTAIDNFRIQARGGLGMMNYRVDDERGYVCGIKIVDETDDIIIISSDGVIIRIKASDVRIMGRFARGVRVMRVKDDVKVVTFTRTEHDDSSEIQEVEQLSEQEIEAEEKEASLAEQNEIISDEVPDDDEE